MHNILLIHDAKSGIIEIIPNNQNDAENRKNVI